MMLRGIAGFATLLVAVAVGFAGASGGSGAAALGPLPFFYDLYTFRGDNPGETTVVAAFAVPVEELNRESKNDETQYRFDVSLVLSDTARYSVVRSDDSVFVSGPRSLPKKHLLHTFVEVAHPPTPHTWQRVIMTDATKPGMGQLYRSAFPIPDYGGTELMISDIALGLTEVAGGWQRGPITLALLPTSQFPESAFNLYYEIYNLPGETGYETEISIVPLDESGQEDEDRDAPVRTRFEERSTAGEDETVAELRRVQSALPKGRYRLTVTVTDGADGRTASQSREFEVRGGRDGTTLVPALPRRSPTLRASGGS